MTGDLRHYGLTAIAAAMLISAALPLAAAPSHAAPSPRLSSLAPPPPPAPIEPSAEPRPRAAVDIPAVAHPPVLISRAPWRWEVVTADRGDGRIFAAAPGAGRALAVNWPSGAVRMLPAGAAGGIAIDDADDKVFLSGGARVVVLDRRSLARIDEFGIPVDAGPVAYDSDDHLLLIGCARSAGAFVVDARLHRMLGEVHLDGVASSICYDAAKRAFFAAVPAAGCVDLIDPIARRVAASWRVCAASQSLCAASDAASDALFVATAAGDVYEIDDRSGACVGCTTLPGDVDAMVCDSADGVLLCESSASGVVYVMDAARGGAPELLGSVTTHVGARDLCVETRGDALDIWTSFDAIGGSYLQCFSMAKPVARD